MEAALSSSWYFCRAATPQYSSPSTSAWAVWLPALSPSVFKSWRTPSATRKAVSGPRSGSGPFVSAKAG
eukprot:1718494-Alexandrium_andersonii.AAC.1